MQVYRHRIHPIFARTLSVLIFFVFLHTQKSNAQERCATVEYSKTLKSERNVLETEQQFEEWLRNKIENRKTVLRSGRIKSGPYQVPIVIHVIHKGEALGTGVNISDAQIMSQISVLNKDFKRLNADASSTPAEFAAVAGNMDIEFILAKRNPEGAATTGITRMQGAQNQWSVNDNYQLKSQSYWPAEDYLNIWVTDLSGGYLGYAQLPVSGLPGLENSSNNRLTDGVVIDYRAFGSIDDGPFGLDTQYNKGRSTTHEMGHFFGLKHIWADDEKSGDTCSGSDYVDDTPNQAISSSGCPTHPRTSCSSNDMFQNFLDYTNDACMNLFTQGQVTRMISVIENSPRRASLLTSPALQDPLPLANDAGIKEILSPGEIECVSPITPSVVIRNYGNNAVTSVQVRLQINSSTIETLTFTPNLLPDQEGTFSFTALPLSQGSYNFSFQILQTNGGADGNSDNNSQAIQVLRPATIPIPFTEEFNTTPSIWTISNPDQLKTWANKTAPRETPSNKAMYMNFYDYEDAEGENDILLTPVFDLSSTPGAYVSFEVSYATFPGSSDGLRVYVLTGCNSDLFASEKVFEKFGSALSTTASTSVAFTPTNANQWRKEIVPLNLFIGQTSVQLAFVGVNDWGNNLYVDKIQIIEADENLTLQAITSPALLNCNEKVTPSLTVRNSGTVTVTSYKVVYAMNSGPSQSISMSTTLTPGSSETISLPEQTLPEGATTFSFELTEPNGLVDAIPVDNKKTINVVYNPSQSVIPIRENFDAAFDSWTIANPTGGASWQSVNTNYNQSLLFNTFDNPSLGDKTWLLSPSLDFSGATKASVFFDVSSGYADVNDSLVLLATRDCGASFETIASYTRETLNTSDNSVFWSPSVPEDWERKFEILNDLTGEPDVRMAFVAINDHGNNIYLDNIEFFTSDIPDPHDAPPPFQIYGTNPASPGEFYLTFNLPEQQSVTYDIMDMVGRTLAREELGYVLNQTFTVDAGRAATGIYILRIQIGDKMYASKVYISNK